MDDPQGKLLDYARYKVAVYFKSDAVSDGKTTVTK
jgi:hypothetical protein